MEVNGVKLLSIGLGFGGIEIKTENHVIYVTASPPFISR